jgi:hypothetical protein
LKKLKKVKNGEMYRIHQSTSKDLYHHDKLSPWEREAYQKIHLGKLYIFRVLIPTPKKLNFLINIFLWVGSGLIMGAQRFFCKLLGLLIYSNKIF